LADNEKPAKGRKRPSRPRQGAEVTKEDILRIATEEFAEHGLTGARVDAIARRTRTSKRMIYYYFGGKEALHARSSSAPMERSVRIDLRDRSRHVANASPAPPTALRCRPEIPVYGVAGGFLRLRFKRASPAAARRSEANEVLANS
jgi:hypothetical protein